MAASGWLWRARRNIRFCATSFSTSCYVLRSNLSLLTTCQSTVYSLSGGFSAGGRAGPVVVYVRRDEVGWGAATAGVGGSGGSLVPTVDLADSVPNGVAGCHSQLGVRVGLRCQCAALIQPRCGYGGRSQGNFSVGWLRNCDWVTFMVLENCPRRCAARRRLRNCAHRLVGGGVFVSSWALRVDWVRMQVCHSS